LAAPPENAGQKLMQTSGSDQERILLNKGLEPDLVIFEPSSSVTVYEFRELAR